jgi:sn-glycerol 3-phosphate transport system permease protein
MPDRSLFRSWWLPYALVLPQILIVFTFFYWPVLRGLWWSFTLEEPFGGGSIFVGLRNFRNLLDNPEYHQSIRVTAVFVGTSTALALGAGLVLAFVADRNIKGLSLFRPLLIWPYAVAAPAAAIAFQFILNPNVGYAAAINAVAGWRIWNPDLDGLDAMLMIIVCAVWKNVAYNFLFLLAGLQALPSRLIEAAALDGAGALRRFRDIQLPLLTPTVFFLLVINITDFFTDSFGIVHVMTGGGPGGSTNLMVYKIFEDGFVGLDLSGSAAQSLVLMAIVIVLTILQFRLLERRIHYAS